MASKSRTSTKRDVDLNFIKPIFKYRHLLLDQTNQPVSLQVLCIYSRTQQKSWSE